MTDPKYMRPGLPFAVGKAVEELGELQSALGKTLRWGWTSVNPELPPADQETNLVWVKREIADVRGALDNCRELFLPRAAIGRCRVGLVWVVVRSVRLVGFVRPLISIGHAPRPLRRTAPILDQRNGER